jgi:hypothetical protein
MFLINARPKPSIVIILIILKIDPITIEAIAKLLETLSFFFNLFNEMIPKIKPIIGAKGIKKRRLKINAVIGCAFTINISLFLDI